ALLSAALPPVVLQQPQDAVTCPAGQATFTLAGIGTIPFTYQWEAESPLGSGTFVPLTDGVTARFIIDGATTRTLTIAANNANPFRPASATNCRGVVPNQCDPITTGAAALIICPVDLDCNHAADVFDLLDYLDPWFPAAP